MWEAIASVVSKILVPLFGLWFDSLSAANKMKESFKIFVKKAQSDASISNDLRKEQDNNFARINEEIKNASTRQGN